MQEVPCCGGGERSWGSEELEMGCMAEWGSLPWGFLQLPVQFCACLLSVCVYDIVLGLPANSYHKGTITASSDPRLPFLGCFEKEAHLGCV